MNAEATKFEIETGRFRSGGFYARPRGACGSCGSSPFLWSMATGPTAERARAAFVAAHRAALAAWADREAAAATMATAAAHTDRLTDRAEAAAADALRAAREAAEASAEAAATMERAAAVAASGGDRSGEAAACVRSNKLTAAALAWEAAHRAARESFEN